MPRQPKLDTRHFPYQVFYLAFYAGYMPLLLFLPLYLKYNGLSTAQVGLLTGLRPLLQSIGAPLLVKLSETFRAKKLLFVVSCILMIGKFAIIFLVLRPEHQICRIISINGEVKDTYIHHKLTKRFDVADEWLQTLNHTASDVSFKYHHNTNIANLQEHINLTAKTGNRPAIHSENPSAMKKEEFHGFINVTRSPALTKHATKVQYRINHGHEVRFIFITVLGLTLVLDYFDAVVFTLVDSAYRPKAAFRGIWVWGDFAWGVMTLIIGVIMDQTAHKICGQTLGSFHYVFYFFCAFVSIAMFIGFRLDLTTDPDEAGIARKIQSSEWNFQYNILILAYALMGFCNGFLFSFFYWFIDTLGGDAMIMGLSTACECLVGVVIFILLRQVVEYIGHMSAVCVGFVGYIGLFLSCYKLQDPWLVIPVKVLQALVSGLMMFTCNSFLKEAAPAGSSYKMQGTLHGIYLAIGTAIGAVFSGFTLDNYRFPLTFLWFTLITCIISFLFLAIQLFVLCKEGRPMSDIESELSSDGSSQFGDDEEDFENLYEEDNL